MASYSKQMIDVAREWLAANPDPDKPILVVPGFSKNGRRRNEQDVDFARYEAAAKKRPEIAPLIDKLRQLTNEVSTAAADLHASEKEVEDVINKMPTPGHEKHSVDDHWHADIGRWCLAWARHGHNVFDLSADFTAAMLLTDARELDIEAIRLPFRGILMLVPDGFARGAEGSSYTRIHVTEIPRKDLRQLDAMNKVVEALQDFSPDERGEVLRELTIGRPSSLLTPKAPDPDDTAIHIYASDGAHVLDTVIERRGLTWDAFDALPDEVTEEADQAARRALRQIVFGTLAYVSAVDRELAEPAVPSGKSRGSKDATPTRWQIGRTIKIDPKLVRAVRDGAREIAFRLKHRHIVRGHYRNQAHGPARSLRTMKWISPYWKGPEGGAELVHTYKPEIT
jgi:hypothetical protein